MLITRYVIYMMQSLKFSIVHAYLPTYLPSMRQQEGEESETLAVGFLISLQSVFPPGKRQTAAYL